MKSSKSTKVLIIVLVIVFILSVISLFYGDYLAANFDVIGIRIAVLIVAFASFGASTAFSLMVYVHNKTVSKINDDSNYRAELFRELQFAANNYSTIEFNDRALIYSESPRYVPRFYSKESPSFHMMQEGLDLNEELMFYSMRIPFKVVEGKTAGSILLSNIKFERDLEVFKFKPLEHEEETQGYILYNEQTKRNNVIINLVFNKNSNFFKEDILNPFSKIKISISVISILGVTIKGISELYFTNPTQIEGVGLHTYKINSSNFRLTKQPFIEHLDYNEHI
jgi:hypothetical protein